MLLCKHSFAIIHSAYVWQSECGTCYCWFICIKTLYHYGYHTFPLLNSPGIYHQRTFHIMQATYNLVQIVLLLQTYQYYFQFFRVCFFLIHIFTGGKKKAIQKPKKKNSCIFFKQHTYLRLNFWLSLLKNDMRPAAFMAEVSCDCSGPL